MSSFDQTCEPYGTDRRIVPSYKQSAPSSQQILRQTFDRVETVEGLGRVNCIQTAKENRRDE